MKVRVYEKRGLEYYIITKEVIGHSFEKGETKILYGRAQRQLITEQEYNKATQFEDNREVLCNV